MGKTFFTGPTQSLRGRKTNHLDKRIRAMQRRALVVLLVVTLLAATTASGITTTESTTAETTTIETTTELPDGLACVIANRILELEFAGFGPCTCDSSGAYCSLLTFVLEIFLCDDLCD